MKKDKHPKYQEALFVDSANGYKFVCGTTQQSKATEKFEGNEYPVIYLTISSASHPFFTGSEKLADVEGRVGKFKSRQIAQEEKMKSQAAKAAAPPPPPAAAKKPARKAR